MGTPTRGGVDIDIEGGYKSDGIISELSELGTNYSKTSSINQDERVVGWGFRLLDQVRHLSKKGIH